jgi:putative membrane protein
MRNHTIRILRGTLSGMAGGLVAAWTMNQFQALLASATQGEQDKGDKTEEEDDATQKAAAAIAEPILERPLTKQEKATAGPAVHYTFAVLMGALYGAIAEASPAVGMGRGLPFGTALWLAADEAAVPALGLAPTPRDTPVSTHASAFAAHLVYGLTMDLVRRGMRRTLA